MSQVSLAFFSLLVEIISQLETLYWKWIVIANKYGRIVLIIGNSIILTILIYLKARLKDLHGLDNYVKIRMIIN
jgi:hypothetical protein